MEGGIDASPPPSPWPPSPALPQALPPSPLPPPLPSPPPSMPPSPPPSTLPSLPPSATHALRIGARVVGMRPSSTTHYPLRPSQRSKSPWPAPKEPGAALNFSPRPAQHRSGHAVRFGLIVRAHLMEDSSSRCAGAAWKRGNASGGLDAMMSHRDTAGHATLKKHPTQIWPPQVPRIWLDLMSSSTLEQELLYALGNVLQARAARHRGAVKGLSPGFGGSAHREKSQFDVTL